MIETITIVYTSETGFTEKYAVLLAEKLNFPVKRLDTAIETLHKNEPIFYLGWLMAGRIKDLDKAKKHFRVIGACGVGIRPDIENMINILTKSLKMPLGSVFYLPGGYDPNTLKKSYKRPLSVVFSVITLAVKKQKEKTPEDENLLNVMANGGSLVDESLLRPLEVFLKKESKKL